MGLEQCGLRREHEQQEQLETVTEIAYSDTLTGVKSKHAFVEYEEKINSNIDNNVQEPFAIVVCDINSLKYVNDTYGHMEGDICIKEAAARICGIFSHCPVFRVGGDEFIVILTRGDYDKRAELMAEISVLPENRSTFKKGKTISAGMAEYNREEHFSILDVCEEADRIMYERKQKIKEIYSDLL